MDPPEGNTLAEEINGLVKTLRFATLMGDAEEATTAAMKLRDATRKLSDKCGEGHDQNVLDLFEQVKTMVLIMKDALRDPSSEFQGPLQEVGRRIMKLASLIELDQAVLALSAPPQRAPPALPSISDVSPVPTSIRVESAKRSPELVVPPQPTFPPPSPPPAAAAPPPLTTGVDDDDELDLPPAESIGGIPMLDTMRRYAPDPGHVSPPARSPSPRAPLHEPAPAAALPVEVISSPASSSAPVIRESVAPMPPSEPASPGRDDDLDNAALEIDLIGFRDSLTFTCDYIQENDFPHAKETIRAAHGYLSGIIATSVDHMDLLADLAVLEAEFKEFVRSVANVLNDPSLLPSFRNAASALVQQAMLVAERIVKVRNAPNPGSLQSLVTTGSRQSLAEQAQPPTKPRTATQSGVWDRMPAPAEPYGRLTPNMATLRKVRGERVIDSDVSSSAVPPHGWLDFETQLLTSPYGLKNVISIAGTPAVPNPALDELANAIIAITAPYEADIPLVCLAVSRESDLTEDPTTLFRGVSIAPKLANAFTRNWALPYLFHVADPTIEEITLGAELEVDPTRATNPDDMQRNRNRFIALATRCLNDIFSSVPLFPAPLRVFYAFLKQILDKRCPQITYRLLGGFYFLRFLCPVLSSPETLEFRQRSSDAATHISARISAANPAHQELVTPVARRSLLLLCKFLQQLGNEVPFDSTGLENEQMSFLNELIVKIRPNMRKFFDEISDLRGCTALPLSPFAHDAGLREDACRVLRTVLVAAREHFKTSSLIPHDLNLAELDKLLAVPVPPSAPPSPQLISTRMRELQMEYLQRGIEDMQADVEKRRVERMQYRLGSVMVRPPQPTTSPPREVRIAGEKETTRKPKVPKAKEEKSKSEEKRMSSEKKKEELKQKKEEEKKAFEQRKKEEEDLARRREIERRREEEKKAEALKASAKAVSHSPLTPAQKAALKTLSYIDAIEDCARSSRLMWKMKGKKDWKEAWAVLTRSDIMLFYENGRSPAPYMTLEFDKWTHVEVAKTDFKNSFQVRNTKEVYHFSIPSDAANAFKWMQLLEGLTDKARQRAAPSRFQG